jgi:hypothetical protein
MRSVIDRNVVMRRMTVLLPTLPRLLVLFSTRFVVAVLRYYLLYILQCCHTTFCGTRNHNLLFQLCGIWNSSARPPARCEINDANVRCLRCGPPRECDTHPVLLLRCAGCEIRHVLARIQSVLSTVDQLTDLHESVLELWRTSWRSGES